MQQYKSNHQLCKELCPTLTVSEAYVREYRAIANDAIDMLLELHWQDWHTAACTGPRAAVDGSAGGWDTTSGLHHHERRVELLLVA